MADLCGPSNGLSNFQKHTAVDRTLQQDRLIARQSPSQGFRSSGPNARQLDPEFEAFQAGNLPLGSQDFQQPPFFSQQQAFQPGPVNWASDFQRLNISAPQQEQLQHGFGGQIQQGGVDWNHEFSRQQNQMGGPSALQRQQQQGSHIQRYTPAMGMGMGMGIGQYPAFQGHQEGYQPQQHGHQQVEHFDDAAFEKAFQEAANVEVESHADILQEEAETQLQSQDQNVQNATLEETLRSSSYQPENAPLNQPLLGSDIIRDPNKPEEPVVDDPDALARTARELIHNLSGDTRSKMQGSEFMKLMRGFAAGTQVVRGEEVVGTANGTVEGGRRPEEALDREQPGIEEGSLKEIFNSISHLSRLLQATLLNPQKPFIRTPSSVRSLLLALLHLDALLQRLTPSTSDNLYPGRGASLQKLKNRLEGAVCSDSLNGLPSVRILAIAVLKRVQALVGNTSEEELLEAGYGYEVSSNLLVTDTYEIQARREVQATEQQQRGILDDVAHANGEVVFVGAPREIATSPAEARVREGMDEEFEIFNVEFGEKVRELVPLMAGREGGHTLGMRELLERCLGYLIHGNGKEDSVVSKVHLQRVSDILGPRVAMEKVGEVFG